MASLTWATTGTVSGLANNQQGNTVAENLAKMLPSGTAPTTTSTGLTTLSGIWWHDTTNNQVKVRDQADTTWITVGTIDETNKLFTAAASGVAAIQGASKNLKVDTRTGSAVATADELVVETTANTYGVLRSVNVTISTGTSGANGIDTGTIAANTWYSVWVIYNGTTVAGLLSTSATAPTMPSGYTYKARVGWVRSNATPVLLKTLQLDRMARYVVDGVILTGLPQISAGTGSYSFTAPTYSAVSVSTFVPSTASAIMIVRGATSSTSNNYEVAPNANYSGWQTTNPPPITDANQGGMMTLESTNIYVACQTSGRVMCGGWEDNL